jgi:hypothetical protein
MDAFQDTSALCLDKAGPVFNKFQWRTRLARGLLESQQLNCGLQLKTETFNKKRTWHCHS